MGRFIGGADRSQLWLLPARIEHWVDDDNPANVIEALQIGSPEDAWVINQTMPIRTR